MTGKSCYELSFRLSNHDACGNDSQCNFVINLAVLFCFFHVLSTSNLNQCIQVTCSTIWMYFIPFWCSVKHYIFNNNSTHIIAIFIDVTIVYPSNGKLQTTVGKIDAIYTCVTTFLLQSHNDSKRVTSQESNNVFTNIGATGQKIEYSFDQHITSASGDTQTDAMSINSELHSIELLFVLYVS